MTTFEFFKEEYDKVHDYAVKCISPEVEVDSFRFVQICWRNFFGGTSKVDKWYNILNVDDTKEMLDQGFLRKKDDTSWIAKQKGTTRHLLLTAKGLKAFYKAMF